MTAFPAPLPVCFQGVPCPPATLELLQLKLRLEEQLLQQQLAQARALSQASATAFRPPPGLEPPCLAQKMPAEDEQSTECGSTRGTDEDSQSEAGSSQPEPEQTTLMIRNVPVLYTRDMLAAEWENEGTYDLLYLPYCCNTQRNLSYAFINFTSEAAALAFVQKWQKQRLAHFSSRKPLNISFADVQGLEPNLLELKKKRVNRVKVEQCQPLIFSQGRAVPMAEAFKAIESRKQGAFQEGQVVRF